ncbi:MAG: 50S ribosomal protein L11 methyltransferase [Paludibacteraceae bacterium]
MNYTVYHFTFVSREDFKSDLLAAQLGEIGFESFILCDDDLDAYIQTKNIDQNKIKSLIAEFPFDREIQYESEEVESKNWNEEWEKYFFEPIEIDNQCVIHSSFHKNFPKLPYDIIIDPKMAFGTGHHETTSLMISEILKMELLGKRVLDMGCGTSVLAILASMREAKKITAIDIDDWCVENSNENIALNHISNIEVLHGDAQLLTGKMFDVILANINRNILLNDLSSYAACLPIGGELLMSGFYSDDVPVLQLEARKQNLELLCANRKNNWAVVKMQKKLD